MTPTLARVQPSVKPEGPISVRPFARLPHDLVADPRLLPIDVTILLALVFYAKDKPACWPADQSIGMRVHRSRATVQRRLRHLEACGLIARDKTDANPTGRIIRLLWGELPRETPPVSSTQPHPVSPVRDELRRGEKETPATRRDGTGSRAETGTADPAPLPSPAEVRDFFAGLRSRPVVRPTGEVIRGLLAARRRN